MLPTLPHDTLYVKHEKAMNGYIYMFFPLNMALSRPFPNDFLRSKSLIIYIVMVVTFVAFAAQPFSPLGDRLAHTHQENP